jgi:NitT/TauT family transport system ATP-binding protein
MDQSSRKKLQARGVRLAYANARTKRRLDILSGIDIAVYEGELVAIVGPSGCGKSSFLAVVDGLVKPSAGTIEVDGRVVTGPGRDRAMVFQQDSLFPWRTVLRNVEYGLELRNELSGSAIRERAQSLIELVGLAGFADNYPHELSGGMRQRVNIARALAPDPELLLLDEPFASLDAQTRDFMQAELLKILARTGTTALFVTHQIDEAVFLSHRVAVFSARPARVKKIVEIDLPPRRSLEMKLLPRFRELQDEIWRSIHEETVQVMAAQ